MSHVERLENRQLLSAATFAVKSAPALLQAHPVAVAATEGHAFAGAVATFTDTGSSTYTATVLWGDGSTSAGTVSPATGGGFEVDASHTYTKVRVFLASVHIVATDGRKATVFSTAKVADAPLTASGQDFQAVRNTVYSGPVATFTDADPNATANAPSTETATINWGDGTVSAGTITQSTPGGAFTVSGKHTYAVANTYTVATKIHDRQGAASATATTIANVIPPFPVTTPSLIGNVYKGTIKGKVSGLPFSVSESFGLTIVDQTINSLTVDVTVAGYNAITNGEIDAGIINNVTAGLLSNGNFIFTKSTSDYTVTISGHVSPDGKSITSGAITLSASALPWTIRGTYSLVVQ